MKSYLGVDSGDMKQLIGLDCDLKDRHIIIVEDIIDTGNTLQVLLNEVNKMQPASISLVSLLFKPESLQHNIKN